MTDELRPSERLALDAWEPMTPPPGFPDRVLDAVPTARRWFPYVATAMATGAAAAIIAVIMMQPGNPAPVDAPQVVIGPPEIDASIAPLAADAAIPSIVDASIPPLPPAPYDVLIAGNQTVTIHDSIGKPTVKLVLTRACAGEISVGVEMMVSTANPVPAKSLPDGSAIITLWDGWFHYTSRCLADGAKQSGTIRVVHDDASRRVSTATPRERVIVDGRAWNVAHAGAMPELLITVPGPIGDTLYVEGVITKTFPIDKTVQLPKVTIPSGTLVDGTYELYADPTRKTKLVLAYDEAAPLLWLERQPTSSPDLITFRGHLVPGWSASTSDQRIALDSNGTFVTGMAISNPHLTIRLDHPTYGTQFYVRH